MGFNSGFKGLKIIAEQKWRDSSYTNF